jgi:hypothetical protein
MRLRTKLAALAVAGGVALSATAAYAAWTASGTGNGTAQAKSAVDLSVTNIAVLDSLYPGGSSALKVNVSNSNDYPVLVTAINKKGGITVDDGHSAGCEASNVSFTDQPGSWAISAHSSLDITLSGAVHMIGNAANGCQGATFTVPVEAVGASNAS